MLFTSAEDNACRVISLLGSGLASLGSSLEFSSFCNSSASSSDIVACFFPIASESNYIRYNENIVNTNKQLVREVTHKKGIIRI